MSQERHLYIKLEKAGREFSPFVQHVCSLVFLAMNDAARRSDRQQSETERENKEEKHKLTMCRFPETPREKKRKTNASASDIKGGRGRARRRQWRRIPARRSAHTASRPLSRTNETHAGQRTTNRGPRKGRKKEKEKGKTTKTSQTTTQKNKIFERPANRVL